MRLSRTSLPLILAAGFAAVLVATTMVGWQMTSRYESLFYAAKIEQTQRLLDAEFAAKLWREQFALAATSARGIANSSQLRRAITARDTAALPELLDDEFHRGAVSSGELTLEGITVYDAEMTPLAERWQSEPTTVPQSVALAAAQRTGIDRLSALQVAWLRDGEPRVTVFVALGLRPGGYIGLHVNPLPALGAIDRRIGMMVEVLSRTDRRLLFSPHNVRFSPPATTRDSLLQLHGPAGEYLADIRVTEDVSSLSQALDATRRTSLLICLAIVGGVAAASSTIVYYFLRQVRRREREDEQRFRDYTDTASDWFWETGPDHRWTYMSDRARVFGVDPSKRIGTSRLAVASDADEEPGKWRDHIAILNRHEPFRDFTYKRNLKEQARYVSVSGNPIFDANGRFRGYRGTARDVTARLHAERQLRDAKAEAEALRDEALSADRAKSEFLATMSHELRTPLNGIIGFSEIMISELMGPIANTRYREYMGDIHDAAHHLLDVINSLLDFAKIQARSLALNEETTDATALIQACVRLVAERARKSRIELRTDVPPELLLRADPLRLKQILLNLLSNAVKFTPDAGKVTVAASREHGGCTTITVTDSGLGMTDAEVEIALQPFRQIDNSLARSNEGTGLGLPLTKALVELHAGRMTIRSAPQCGTSVTVMLPADRMIAGVQPLRAAS